VRSNKDDIRGDIDQTDKVISKLYRLIDELEFDLKRKLDALGIKVTRAQIRVMTTRIDGLATNSGPLSDWMKAGTPR